MDPLGVITTISLGLTLVDQFRELALRFEKRRVTPVAATARQSESGDALQIAERGHVYQEIAASDLKLDEWDEPRYRALERRVRVNWDYFNELFAQNVGLAPEETARLNIRIERTEDELCEDFREMVGIYERALQIRLPDHYQLYEVCAPPPL